MESIPVEMRMMIMEHLYNTDLISLSIVNKLFNYEARSFMRDRANITAVLKSSCEEILPFASDLKKMNIVPFSGIIVQLYPKQHHRQLCQPSSSPKNEDLHAGLNAIVNRLPLKRLQITLHHGYLDVTDICAAQLLVKKLLESSSSVLEELTLVDNLKLLELVQEVVGGSRFQRLKILKLEDNDDGKKTPKNFIKHMVSRSPNLKELHQEKQMDYSENVLEGSSAVLVSNYDFEPLIYELTDSVAGVVRLTRMTLKHHATSYYHLRVEKFNRAIPMMLQTSLATLNSLCVDLVLAVPLMGYGISLMNVTNLTMYICCPDFKFIQPRALQLLERFDFARIFPGLDKVEIQDALINRHFQENLINEFIEQEIAAIVEPKFGRAANIKQISFRDSFIEDAVAFYAEMFPDIEKLKLLTFKGRKAPYQLIWKHWRDLKEVEIQKYGSAKGETWNENLDSVFCGISPAECAQLREQDDEYLRAVNVVPVSPSISCMKALRKLIFYYAEPAAGFNDPFIMQKIIMTDSTMFIFSKVTGLIAFQRCPNLSVIIGTNSSEILKALRNMRPYASVGFKCEN